MGAFECFQMAGQVVACVWGPCLHRVLIAHGDHLDMLNGDRPL